MIMFVKKECFNLCNDKGTVYFKFEQATECPRCHCGIAAQEITPVIYYNCQKVKLATVFNFCTRCQSCFITTYNVVSRLEGCYTVYYPSELIISEPTIPDDISFTPSLTEISPNFVEIYNQAHRAEIYSLNQIAGMGYRKALEFLIKDYAIHLNPNEEDSIKNQLLAQCINTYIDNPKIKVLAEKSAWLGNDETHYVKKHPDFNVNDLRLFIDTCVNYIDMELNLEKASSIHKK